MDSKEAFEKWVRYINRYSNTIPLPMLQEALDDVFTIWQACHNYALEEAAKVCEASAMKTHKYLDDDQVECRLADAIRAMKTQGGEAMIIKCRKCGKEFDTATRRNQHEKDAHGYKAGKSPFKPAQQPEQGE